MSSPIIFIAVSLIIASCVNAAKVPANWKVCKRSLPPADYDSCIREAVPGAVYDLIKNGQPSLGIPPINPLKITSLDIGQGTGPVAIDLHFKDLELDGIDGAVFGDIRHKDAGAYKFGADVTIKKPLVLRAKYSLNGKVLVLPIKGQGDCKLVFDNLRVSLDLNGQPFKKGEETYMNVTNIDLKFETDRLHLQFNNLFDGNKELGNNMNIFLNENWSEILRELKPAISQAFSAAFTSISNQIFHKIPHAKLMPK